MGKWLGIAMSLVLAFTLAACSQPATNDAADTTSDTDGDVSAPIEVPVAPAVDEAATGEPATEEAAPADPMDAAPAEPADPAATPPAVDGAAAPADDASADASGLVGTKWKYDAYTAEFAADNVLNVSMGEMKIPGEYKLGEDGSVEISAMGSSFTGNWDGTTLTIDGQALEKVE